ncbi:ribonucleotide-diphosphate reductase subunit beta [Cupriavidus campinensis]|uniref:ribonucleotide-diphosphate reductase subunit beta n=1 Tax=Cupriavidus campinensis TaxID=151783 RepID=UPI001C91166F|nr:ribonucleotide-diphosphate reductase subunit beta [Cupriavidus campinensis]
MTNLSSAARVNARRLIEGPSDKLMAVTPLKHKWAWEILEVMEQNTWFPHDVRLGNDKLFYQTRLTDQKKEAFDGALAFLSNLDGLQLHNITDNIVPHVTSPEVRMCLTRQAWEEAVHVKSYSTGIEEFSVDPMQVYTRFERDGVLAAKNAHVMRQSAILGESYSARNFTMALVANVALEGIYFYSGFLIFYILAKAGEMVQWSDMIRYIQRDEETHLRLFEHMLATQKEERPELFNAKFYDDALVLLDESCKLESNWGRHLIGKGILGYTPQMVDAYIKTLTNKRAKKIGLPELYPGVVNPVSWVETFSEVNDNKINFFEAKPAAYSVGALDWD